mmetsp:Transcript_1886/g.4242  ORF Transcript_1886/g.4242 Transcript_1886/m.4242 type:complete len:228 (+) Transcript_1886:753-1436(+)
MQLETQFANERQPHYHRILSKRADRGHLGEPQSGQADIKRPLEDLLAARPLHRQDGGVIAAILDAASGKLGVAQIARQPPPGVRSIGSPGAQIEVIFCYLGDGNISFDATSHIAKGSVHHIADGATANVRTAKPVASLVGVLTCELKLAEIGLVEECHPVANSVALRSHAVEALTPAKCQLAFDSSEIRVVLIPCWNRSLETWNDTAGITVCPVEIVFDRLHGPTLL